MENIIELFRYEIVNYHEGYHPELRLDRYKVISETKCGFWIDRPHHNKKFVLRNDYCSGKRFAYTTEKSALEALLHRRRRHLTLLKIMENRALKAIEMITKVQKGDLIEVYPGLPF